jgi:hypothetical protein
MSLPGLDFRIEALSIIPDLQFNVIVFGFQLNPNSISLCVAGNVDRASLRTLSR